MRIINTLHCKLQNAIERFNSDEQTSFLNTDKENNVDWSEIGLRIFLIGRHILAKTFKEYNWHSLAFPEVL